MASSTKRDTAGCTKSRLDPHTRTPTGRIIRNLFSGILLSTELWTCSCEPKWIRILQRSYPPSYSQVVAYGKSKDAGLPKGKSWRRFSAGKVGDVHLSS